MRQKIKNVVQKYDWIGNVDILMVMVFVISLAVVHYFNGGQFFTEVQAKVREFNSITKTLSESK